jgi:hypothetical protein
MILNSLLTTSVANNATFVAKSHLRVVFCWGKKHHSNDDLRRAFEYSIHVVPVKSVAPVKDAALIPTTEFIGKAK